MTRKMFALIAAVFAVTACYHGKQVTTLTTPTVPNGAQIVLDLPSGTYSGELMSVEQNGLLLLSGTRLVLVPFESVRHSSFPEFSSIPGVRDGQRDERALAKMRLLSHFPAGLSPEIKQQLLSIYHQTEWATVR